ncbi:histidine kinase, partial [aff. Roholtiella sp. LEGE 12411]|nr:histidine kinase [aff. Roholtiella sp. LEGE 12411]
MGIEDWGLGKNSFNPQPNAPCPIPHAPCPMP